MLIQFALLTNWNISGIIFQSNDGTGFKLSVHETSKNIIYLRIWRNRQTRQIQVLVVAIPCVFKSHYPHQRREAKNSPFRFFLERLFFWFTFFWVLVVSVIFETICGGLHLLKGGMNINCRCTYAGMSNHTAEGFNVAAAL